MNIEDDVWAAQWPVRISVRYHTRRQAFFETWSRVTAAIGVIFGSSAVASAIASVHAAPWLLGTTGVAMTVAATVDLIVGTASMARKHDDLRKRFMLLDSEIESAGAPTIDDIIRWKAARLVIEMDEPPPYIGLTLLCENELAMATQGLEQKRTRIRWLVGVTAQWLRWPNEHAQPI